MAKKGKKSSAEKQAIEQITSILDKMSDRLVSLSNRLSVVGTESAQTADKVNSFLSRERLINAKLADAYSAGVVQAEVNRKTTDSLYALRDSTGKAFDNVTADVKSILSSAKVLQERVGKLESQKVDAVELGVRLRNADQRTEYLEQKLNAVYATVQSLFAFTEIKGKDSKGEFIYIHPLDLAELLQNAAVVNKTYSASNGPQTFIEVGETRYLQSPFVPRRPGAHKIV